MARPLVHPRMVAQMRQLAESAMPETVEVQRGAATPDGQGGSTDNWTTVATTKGHIMIPETTPQERFVPGRTIEAATAYTIVMPVDTDVRPSDRLVIGDRTFEVVAPVGPVSYATSISVVCRLIE